MREVAHVPESANRKRFRILMLHNRYKERGGEEESTAQEYRLLRSYGHHVDLLEEDNTRVARIGTVRTAARATWSMEAHRSVTRALSSNQYDLVHVQNFFPLLSPSVHWAAHKARVAVVQTLRNYRLQCANGIHLRDGATCVDCLDRSLPWPAVWHGCYRNSRLGSGAVALSQVTHRVLGTWRRCVDAFITLTRFSHRLACSSGLDPSRVFVKPNFLAPDPGAGHGGDAFLFVGRLSAEKGVTTLLRAWDLLSATGTRLEVIGDGPLREQVVDAQSRLNVRFLGRLPNERVVDHLGSAKALVVPSECFETFGRVVMEAFSRGTPVIASRHGALEELVTPEQTGLLFEPGNQQELATQVLRVHRGPPKWMREAARSDYVTRFGPDTNHDQLTAIYRSALEYRSARKNA